MAARTTRSAVPAAPAPAAAAASSAGSQQRERALPSRAARPSANSLSEQHMQLTAVDRPGGGLLPSATSALSTKEDDEVLSTAASSVRSSTRGRSQPAAASASAAEGGGGEGGGGGGGGHKRKRPTTAGEDDKEREKEKEEDATVATAGTTRSSARARTVVKMEDEASVTTAGSSSAAAGATAGATAKKSSKGGYGGGSSSCVFSSDPPKRLMVLTDRSSRGTPVETVIRIRPPDVLMKAFDWSHKSQKYYVLAFVSGMGERVRPGSYKGVPVRYSIAALEEKEGKKGATHEEELYQGECLPTLGGLYYFKIPSFRIPGRYRLSFAVTPGAGEGRPPGFPPTIEAISHVVTVVAQAQGEEEGDVDGAGGKAAAAMSMGKGGRPLRSSGDVAGGEGGEAGASLADAYRARVDKSKGEAAALAAAEAAVAAAAAQWEFGEREVKGRAFALTVPGELRRQLCEDWYLVTRRRRLVPLPRRPTVLDILRGFEKQQQQQQQGGSGPALSETGQRLLALFDGALGNLLLYRFERDQYVQALLPALRKATRKGGGGNKRGESGKGKGKDQDDEVLAGRKAPHTVYGAEHLLRLLVSAPRFLTLTDGGAMAAASDPAVGDTQAYLQALLEHMAERQGSLFAAHQEAAPGYAVDVPKAHRP